MQFKQIIGQQSLKRSLTESVRANRIPHAQLFLGPQGSGKLALAIAYAQYLMCTQKSEADSCGQCPSCHKIQKLIHPDLHFSFPFVGAKLHSSQFLEAWRKALLENPYLTLNEWLGFINAENKQGNINKEECLQIIKKLSLKTFESDYKVLILWLPEYLAKEGNRLLKIIEEPPQQTVFILVAEDQEKILPTILSRCQMVKIPALSDKDIREGLEQKGLQEEQRIIEIIHLAEGNFSEALALTDTTENDNATLLLEWLRKCYMGNGIELNTWVENFSKLGRENQKHFLQYALHFMRELLVVKMSGNNSAARLAQKELDSALRMTKIMDFYQIEDIVEIFNHCYYAVERNAHPKILFLNASIQINNILKKKSTLIA